MQLSTTVESVDRSLDELTKSLPPDFVGWLKQRFESVIQNLLRLEFADIRVDFVVDTNTVIRSLLGYAKGKAPCLFRLIKNEIFKFHAPAYIEHEIAKFIRTNKKRISNSKLFEGWLILKKNLRIGTLVSVNALSLVNAIIGNRDHKDVPFVAMYIDLGASNILTYDKDFDHPLLRTLRIEGLGQALAAVNRGLLSFFVLSDLTPGTLNFFGQLILGLIRNLFDAIKLLIDFFSAVARNAINEATNLLSNFFPGIRDWLQSGLINDALLAITLIVAGAVIIDKDIRNNLLSLINFIIKSLQPTLDKFVNWLDRTVRLLCDCAKAILPHVLAVLVKLLVNISTVVSHVKVMPSEIDSWQ